MSTSGIVRLLSLAVVALLASLAGIEPALAQWTFRTAPQPLIRNITVFANDPLTGTHTLIVSTLADGMYKGTDNGTAVTWQKIGNGIPIVQVRAHTTVGNTDFYAATTGAGLYKTTDGGANWTAINGSGGAAIGCLNISSIAVTVTAQPRTLLVSTSCLNGSGVYRSTDDGATWSRLGPAAGNANSLPDDVQASALTRSGTLMFLATSNYGIFKSSDDGLTWATANVGITPTNVNVFNTTFSGISGTAILLAYVHGNGVYRSTDTGANWTPSNSGLPSGFAALGGINRDSGQTLYLGLDKQGLYKTADGGLTWNLWGTTATDANAKYARGISSVATISGLYYLTTLEGVVKTTDNGATLQLAGVMPGGRVNAMAHDRDSPIIAYLATKLPLKISDIYGNYSNPAQITPLDNGVTGATNDGVVYQDRLTPSTLYVTTNNRGIFKSTDSGASFTPINNGLPNMIGKTSRLAYDPVNSQNLYLGLSDAAGMYKSTDGGALWAISSAGLSTPQAMSINHVTADINDSTIVWAATDAGAFKSTDSGANWTQMYAALDGAGSVLGTTHLRVRAGISNEVYIANNHANANGTLTASSGILKSIDGGTTWNNILPNQRGSQVRVTAGGDIYAGVSAQIGNPAVYLSTDGGTSFSAYSTNLQGSNIRSFGIGADDSVVISLSLENGFYTSDAGQTPILRVNKAGAGTVTSATAGIDCGTACAASVAAGSVVVLTATPAPGWTFSGWSGGGCTGAGTCSVTVNLATTITATFTGGSFSLVAVRSRKTHGALGAFDVNIDTAIPITGAVSVEPRALGAGHKMVFQFSGPVTSVGSVTSLNAASASIGSPAYAISGNEVVVTLKDMQDNQRANITLTGINGTALTASAAVGFLVGDANGTRQVNAGDTSSVKARSAQATTTANFKFDLNTSGAINAADIATVKARPGTLLP